MYPIEDLRKKHFQNMQEIEKEELSANAESIEQFKNICEKKGLKLSDSNFSYIHPIGIVASYPNILSILNSNIEQDKEGLIDWGMLNNQYTKKDYINGFLYDRDKYYMITAHPFFRRRFSKYSNFAPHFIKLFWELNKAKWDLSIAIDFDNVRINVDNSVYLEEDTWYGAKFTKNISLIPDGISKHTLPINLDNTILNLLNNVYALNTSWETKGEIKEFQAEEFKTEEEKITINGNTWYPTRYIHAEFDLDKKAFRHFDGAVHLYNKDEYYQRRDSDINYNSKNTWQIKSISQKLFKMNGPIDVDTFVLFSSHFFSGNPLIIEYFEGKYPDYATDILRKSI